MTDTPPPTTRPSAVHENPIVAANRRAETAEREAQELRVRLASLRPSIDRPPLSKRVVQAVQATPPLLQWAALLTALAAFLGAAVPLVKLIVEMAR